MKKHWYQWMRVFALMFVCFSITFISSTSADAATSPKGTNAPFITQASASDPYGDPYAMGCANHLNVDYKQANAGTLEINGSTVAWIYNYYSTTCNKNWVYVTYNTGSVSTISIDIHKKGTSIIAAPSGNHQCYPTDCLSSYSGRLSPTWSDMVDGTPVDCIWVGLTGTNGTFVSTYTKYGNTDDAICA